MRILAFDTATRATSVALVDTATGVVAEARDDPPAGLRPRHTTHLLTLIAEVVDQGGGWGAVDRIAVGVGPGTFTGLRIGIATAQALARARQIPLVGISTLASLALGATPCANASVGQIVVAVIDARRGEVFAAAWSPAAFAQTPASEPLLAPAPLAPEALVQAIGELGSPGLAVGDGAVEFRQVLEASGATIPDRDSDLHRVNARHHAHLAVGADPKPGAGVHPDYLRLPDAELSLRAAQKR
jgi:tRNA threonylcarbamoyladenosine biosynthesis protein TsaB